jgi:hypothetical protein
MLNLNHVHERYHIILRLFIERGLYDRVELTNAYNLTMGTSLQPAHVSVLLRAALRRLEMPLPTFHEVKDLSHNERLVTIAVVTHYLHQLCAASSTPLPILASSPSSGTLEPSSSSS